MTNLFNEYGCRGFFPGYASSLNYMARGRIRMPDFSRGFERDRRNVEKDWERVGAAIRAAFGQCAEAANG